MHKTWCMKSLLVLILFSTLNYSANAQSEILHYCGTDELRVNSCSADPSMHQKLIQVNEELNKFTNDYISSSSKRAGQVYIIPVVFHIIHNYGAENISNAQILDAIAVLNRNYRKQNADTIDIVPAFKSIAADCEIELRLAQKDPDGNCTSGINRIASPLTYIGDHSVKSLIHWDPTKYLNVYVCFDAATIAGHAIFPADAEVKPEWDGIVIRHDYLGSIGTSTPFRSVVLSHELGHYLNLQHIWGGNNVPGYFYLPVAQANNCNFDDGVQDTPNTIGWQNCNLSGASCGNTIDNVQNFMDYAYCARMLTEGQKLRMHAALNSPIGKRNNLWQPANLTATGVDVAPQLCAAEFKANKTKICANNSVTFTDVSFSKTTGRTWSFPGGTPSTSSDSVVTVNYGNPGMYDVILTTQDGANSKVKSATNFITVTPELGQPVPYFESFENMNSLPDAQWQTTDFSPNPSFQINTSAAYTYSQSTAIVSVNDTTTKPIEELISPLIDASNATSPTLSFRYAFAYKDLATGDRLRIFFSKDCGLTWVQQKMISGNLLATAPATNTLFIPSDSTQWKTDVINIPNNYLTYNLQVKFAYEFKNGNALYIDDINLGEADPTSVTNEINAINSITVFPNPFTDELAIEFDQILHQKLSIKVLNQTGQIIKELEIKSIADSLVKLPLHELTKGIYYISIDYSGNKVWEKIVKL